MRRTWILCVALCACGGRDEAGDDDDAPPIDAAADDIDADPALGERRWRLEDRDASSIVPLDEEALTTARAARVEVAVALGPCEELAMIDVAYGASTPSVVITARAWVPVGGPVCPGAGRTAARPVVLDLPLATTYSVIAAGVAAGLELAVAAGPDDCDPTRTPCEADCDCDAGERCLGFFGLGGPGTQCARPCEIDRDCLGGTCEIGVDDGLDYACSSAPECASDPGCPDGWSCGEPACEPDFILSQDTRVTCARDADCAAGLRCVIAADESESRCQAVCHTGALGEGAWCQGPHACFTREMDVSGLAGTDAVCGWVGD